MEDKKGLSTHFDKLRESLRRMGGKAFLNVCTFEVEVRLGDRLHKLYPVFKVRMNDISPLTPVFVKDAYRFVGWRPYPVPPAFSFSEKLTFKKLLMRHHFAVPEYSTDPDSRLTDVIVKKRVSSFSMGIKGPFRSASECRISGKDGEYYEKFISGKITKIFFWNARPVSIEIKDMPVVVGDGRSTISELLAKKSTRRAGKKRNYDIAASTVAFYNKDLSTVLPLNQAQIIDYRYSSEYASPHTEEIDLLTTKDPRFDPLRQLGEVLWTVLQQEGHPIAAYTVDAMLDANNKLWFLEANPNPATIDPESYPLTLQWLAQSVPKVAAPSLTQPGPRT